MFSTTSTDRRGEVLSRGSLLGTHYPAKFSRKLIYWIIQHGLERGYWRPGDLLLDPFAGVGCGGIAATDLGLRWLGVELEPRFVEMATQNFLLHTERWLQEGKMLPDVIQGDSRRLAEILEDYFVVEDRGMGVVTSPPYANRVSDHGTDKPGWGVVESMGEYGSEDGQVGNWFGGKMGSVFSPSLSQPDARDRRPVQDGSVADFMTRAATVDRQGEMEGNLAHLRMTDGAVSSPPYLGGGHHQHQMDAWNQNGGGQGYTQETGGYGRGDGNRETYWDACRQVYTALHSVLPPGAVIAIVVKDFVRAKQVVPLCDMTSALLQQIGFVPLETTVAMLYSVNPKTGAVTAHKGFFRRLAESKGSPAIDYEQVLWMGRV